MENFGILDIVIGVLGLLSLIIGFKKGLVKQLTGGLAFLGSIVLAVMFYKYVAKYIIESDIFYNLELKVLDWMKGRCEESLFTPTLNEAGTEGVQAALVGIGIPKLALSLFTKGLAETIAANPDVLVGDYLANMLTTKAITVGSFIATFLVCFIVLKIIIGLLRKIREIPGIGFIDGLLGGAYSLIQIAIVVCVLFWVATLLTSVPGLGDTIANFLKSDMKLDVEEFGIAKFVYLNNPIDKLLSSVNFNDLLNQVMGK